MEAPSLPVRTAVCLLAVLLTLTPISQVLAQTSQQSQATQSDKQDEETDKTAILRPDATIIFPKGDSIHVADSAAAVLTGPVSPAEAQQNDTTTKEVCFRGRPLPHCRWFWLTEIGVRFRLATNSDFTENRSALTLEVGGMRNLGSHSAVGATIFFADPQDADESRSGVRARYRWWLGSVAAVEVAPGILFEVNDVRFRSQLPGFSGQVAFDVGNLVGVNAQLDVVRGSVTQIDWYAGIRGGSGVGAAGGIALGILTAIALVVFAATGGL